MAMDQSALLDALTALKDTDVCDRIRVATERLYQELIDAEVTAVIGAGPWQRTTERATQRNRSRDRVRRLPTRELGSVRAAHHDFSHASRSGCRGGSRDSDRRRLDDSK